MIKYWSRIVSSSIRNKKIWTWSNQDFSSNRKDRPVWPFSNRPLSVSSINILSSSFRKFWPFLMNRPLWPLKVHFRLDLGHACDSEIPILGLHVRTWGVHEGQVNQDSIFNLIWIRIFNNKNNFGIGRCICLQFIGQKKLFFWSRHRPKNDRVV